MESTGNSRQAQRRREGRLGLELPLLLPEPAQMLELGHQRSHLVGQGGRRSRMDERRGFSGNRTGDGGSSTTNTVSSRSRNCRSSIRRRRDRRILLLLAVHVDAGIAELPLHLQLDLALVQLSRSQPLDAGGPAGIDADFCSRLPLLVGGPQAAVALHLGTQVWTFALEEMVAVREGVARAGDALEACFVCDFVVSV